jgi:predicted transcriptional regulator
MQRVPLTIRIDPNLRQRVQREAERNRRTIGAEIMAMIDDALAARQSSPMPMTADTGS